MSGHSCCASPTTGRALSPTRWHRAPDSGCRTMRARAAELGADLSDAPPARRGEPCSSSRCPHRRVADAVPAAASRRSEGDQTGPELVRTCSSPGRRAARSAPHRAARSCTRPPPDPPSLRAIASTPLRSEPGRPDHPADLSPGRRRTASTRTWWRCSVSSWSCRLSPASYLRLAIHSYPAGRRAHRLSDRGDRADGEDTGENSAPGASTIKSASAIASVRRTRRLRPLRDQPQPARLRSAGGLRPAGDAALGLDHVTERIDGGRDHCALRSPSWSPSQMLATPRSPNAPWPATRGQDCPADGTRGGRSSAAGEEPAQAPPDRR